MAIKYETIKAGDLLYQKIRRKMGNTTISQDVVYTVRVVSIDEHAADVVWNGCNNSRWYRGTMEKLYRTEPKKKPNPFSRVSRV